MRALSRLLWLSCSATAACDPSIANYCAPGTPECAIASPDGGADASAVIGADAKAAEASVGIDADAAQPGDSGSADATVEADAAPPIDSALCDPTKGPHDEACVVDEAYGVFVSPTGSDAFAGTRASPFRTIAEGMDSAKSSGKPHVYVCSGSYPEALVVRASRDGLSVFGGLDCATWTYSASSSVTIAPGQPGYALDVEGLANGVTFEDVAIMAENANAANPGESSVAVLVNGSTGVVFQRVTMVAGSGANGASGASGGLRTDGGTNPTASNWLGTPPGYAALDGNDATSTSGGGPKICSCPDGTTSVGGQGSSAGDGGVQGPGPGLPAYGASGDAGLSGRNGASCGGGGSPAENGLDAPQGKASSPSTSWGALGPSGWTPAVGSYGSNGQPGQGGGGGGNGPASTGFGGSGACGGCGGIGGRPGAGGGASIGLLVYESAVSLVGCTIVAHDAGSGGPGGNGEPGQAGGLVGGTQNGSGCPGGAGGSGGGGNGGQGGPGGLSLGIAFTGKPPTFDGAPVASGLILGRVVVGAGGAGGSSGLPGAAATTTVGQPQAGLAGPPGTAGVAQSALGF